MRKSVWSALACPDDVWYGLTLQKDPRGGALSAEEERSVIKGATSCALLTAEHMIHRYGPVSPQELAARLGLKLTRTSEKVSEPFLYLSLYLPAQREIILYDRSLELIEGFLRQNGLEGLTPPEDVSRAAIYHEIFHAWEEDTPGLYTRSRMLERKALGLFPVRRALDGACEVGAAHFSKHMAALSYSPCIYEFYLLLALDRILIDFLPSTR